MRPGPLLIASGVAATLAAFGCGWFLTGSRSGVPEARPAPMRAIEARPADDRTAVADLAFFIADDHPARSGGEVAPAAPSGDPVIDYGGDPPPVPAPVPVRAAPPAPSPPPPPPPPPDVSVVFRRQLVAVVSEPDGALSVLVNGPQGRRKLRLGDVFQDDWRLVGLTRDAAVLRQGERSRRIPFFGGAVTDEG